MMREPSVSTGPVSRRKAALFSVPETLNQALYQLVHNSPQTVAMQAEQLNLSRQFIYNIGNPNLAEDGVAYPLKHLIPHTQFTKNLVAVDFIERELGRVAVPVVQQLELYRPTFMRIDLLGIATEFGEAAAALKKGLADGKMSHTETKRFRKELWDVIQEAVLVYQESRTLEG
jgi:hypothetical protein